MLLAPIARQINWRRMVLTEATCWEWGISQGISQGIKYQKFTGFRELGTLSPNLYNDAWSFGYRKMTGNQISTTELTNNYKYHSISNKLLCDLGESEFVCVVGMCVCLSCAHVYAECVCVHLRALLCVCVGVCSCGFVLCVLEWGLTGIFTDLWRKSSQRQRET